MNTLKNGTGEKLWFLDNLKIGLTILVIIHHAGQAYGPGGWWYYQSPEKLDWLKLLFVLDRSFFMSLFFMISGYFLARSLSKVTNYTRFIKERLYRFGVPLLLFGFGVLPAMLFFYHLYQGDITTFNFFEYYRNFYLGIGTARPEIWTGASWPDLQFGHLWFIEHLMILSIIIALLHRFKMISFAPAIPVATHRIMLLLPVLALITIVTRHFSPIDKWTAMLGFIQIAYADVPRDLFFFVLGLYSFRTDLFTKIKTDVWKPLLTTVAGLALLLAMLFFVPVFRMTTVKSGVWGTVFPLWESLYCYCICFGLIYLFKDKFNSTNAFVRKCGTLSFGAYLMHVPVIVCIQYVLGYLHVGALPAFIIVSIIGTAATYGTVYCIDRVIPKRVTPVNGPVMKNRTVDVIDAGVQK